MRQIRVIIAAFAAGLFLAATGCAPEKSRIAEVEPYLGQRPAAAKPLPERPPPVARRHAAGGPAPGWTPPGGFSGRWRSIVIHHSANDKSTPEGMRSWHMNGRGWDELGYHFVVGNGIGYGDGKVYVGARWTQQKHGAHCKTPDNFYNEHGIGICLIGNFDARPPTPKQLDALARLVNFLCDRTGIPASKVQTHGGITNKTACPGRYFSLPALRRALGPGRSAGAADQIVENLLEADLGIIP